MLLIFMVVYALVLLTLAVYLITHRHRPFLSVNIPSPALASNMLLTAILLIICAIIGIVGGVINSTILALIALAVSAIFVGLFGLSLIRAIN